MRREFIGNRAAAWSRISLTPAMIYYVMYVSSATRLLSGDELARLLAISRENNVRNEISGMLVYRAGNFMQVLEGEEQAVRTLYAKIGRDARHDGVISLLEGRTLERQFPEWSMAFRNFDGADTANIPNYSDFLSAVANGQEFGRQPSRCQRLLLSFKAHMR